LIRAPLWLIGLLIVAAIGVGIYAYLTTPLPLGLSSVIRTPGGASAAVTPLPGGSAAGARAAAGEPLVLGAATVTVRAVQRNQDLAAGGRGGPPGMFTVLDVQLQNAGAEPLTPALSDFRLMDDQGRIYALDSEATRAVNTSEHRRNLFEASVPPGAAVDTFLAFETSAAARASMLRVSMGYGDLVLP
jgi:Domain of unknown function (DUF4352)